MERLTGCNPTSRKGGRKLTSLECLAVANVAFGTFSNRIMDETFVDLS